MPSHQINSHSQRLRWYSDGGATSGTGVITAGDEAREWTETSGRSSLTICSDSKGMVGTSSGCTDSGMTTCKAGVEFFFETEAGSLFSVLISMMWLPFPAN